MDFTSSLKRLSLLPEPPPRLTAPLFLNVAEAEEEEMDDLFGSEDSDEAAAAEPF